MKWLDVPPSGIGEPAAPIAGSLQRGEFSITGVALLSPLYWGLMSLAAWKGFIQLFTNPFYWEKTEHGLDEDHA